MVIVNAESLCWDAYDRYNNKQYLSPDPLEIVLARAPSEQETVGLLSACLAMGRVGGILKAIHEVLRRVQTLGQSGICLSEILLHAKKNDLIHAMEGFSFRFFTAKDLAAFFFGISGILKSYGSLENCFAEFSGAHTQVHKTGSTMPCFSGSIAQKGLSGLVDQIRRFGGNFHPLLLSNPSAGSASKRLHLYLRWMVRKDSIDPGCWTKVASRELWMPLDTHSLRHCQALGLTHRKNADARTMEEVTDAFRAFSPNDPCQFDFALSRMGIHPHAKEQEATVYSLHRVSQRPIL